MLILEGWTNLGCNFTKVPLVGSMLKRMNFYNHHIESNTISLTFELRGSLGIPRQARSALKIFALGAGLGIPSEPRSSKVRLKVLLTRMTSGIHAPSLAIISWNFNSLSIRRMLQKKVFSLGRKNKRHHL